MPIENLHWPVSQRAQRSATSFVIGVARITAILAVTNTDGFQQAQQCCSRGPVPSPSPTTVQDISTHPRHCSTIPLSQLPDETTILHLLQINAASRFFDNHVRSQRPGQVVHSKQRLRLHRPHRRKRISRVLRAPHRDYWGKFHRYTTIVNTTIGGNATRRVFANGSRQMESFRVLEENQDVEFEIRMDKGTPVAMNVRVIRPVGAAQE